MTTSYFDFLLKYIHECLRNIGSLGIDNILSEVQIGFGSLVIYYFFFIYLRLKHGIRLFYLL